MRAETMVAYFMASFMSKTLGIYPPDFVKFVIGEPERAEAHTQRVAAFSYVLSDDAVGGWIDFRERFADGRHPHSALPYRDVAAGARHAHLNGRGNLVGGRIHARYAAVSLIERPNAAQPGGQESRRRAHRDVGDHFLGLRIH